MTPVPGTATTRGTRILIACFSRAGENYHYGGRRNLDAGNIESVDLTGKTILPFVTYAVSGMSGIDDDYRQALPGSNVRDGLAVQGETVTQAAPDLDKWLSTNDLA
jgi:flavodoxin-like protein